MNYDKDGDEIDSRLHPILVRFLVMMFNSISNDAIILAAKSGVNYAFSNKAFDIGSICISRIKPMVCFIDLL